MNINQQLGRNIRFLRKAIGIKARGNPFSQQELADMMNVSRKTMVFWESGHIPSAKKLAGLCQLFSQRLSLEEPLTPDDLLNKDIQEYFIIIAERNEVKRVKPEHKKVLENIFVRASDLDPDDLQKILKLVEQLSD